MPAAASEPPAPVAVLPIEEDELFRAERAQLRASLAAALATRAPELSLVPFAEVDAKRDVAEGLYRTAKGNEAAQAARIWVRGATLSRPKEASASSKGAK